MKICNKCGEEKPLTSQYFNNAKKSKDGFRNECKVCVSEYNKQYAIKHQERLKQYRAGRYEQHYNENKELISMQNRKYRENNKEVIKARKQEYYQRNKETISETKKQYYYDNIEFHRQLSQKYYQKNKERLKDYAMQYRLDNRAILNVKSQKRKAMRKKIPSTLTIVQWNSIKKDFGNSCAYCGLKEEEHKVLYGEQLHQEHFIPFNENGEHSHNNIIPSCKSCNSSKHDRDFFEWYPKSEHYNEDREQFILEYLGYLDENIQQLSIL